MATGLDPAGFQRDIHELRLEAISFGESKRTEEEFG